MVAAHLGITPEPVYWVYILHCENNTYYTGYTIDLQKRYQSHVDGSGKCKYTRSFKPTHIAQCWQIKGDKALAMQVERYIKTLSRAEKERIIACPTALSVIFKPNGQYLSKISHEFP
ncbi:MAG: GIY-YIG nuclease family protein [Legionellaceae bacterium]|nr:GIY-YIG nuclease family protein [Legionellaceae bacterium]